MNRNRRFAIGMGFAGLVIAPGHLAFGQGEPEVIPPSAEQTQVEPASPPAPAVQPTRPEAPPLAKPGAISAQPEAPLDARTMEQMSASELMRLAETRRDFAEDASDPLAQRAAYQEALLALNRVIEREPDNFDALNLRGEILAATGDHIAARNDFMKVRSVQESDFRANLGLGKFHLRANYPRQAMFYLEFARKVAPPDKRQETLEALVEAYMGAGKWDEAQKALQEMDPENRESRRLATVFWSERENFDAAHRNADQFIDISRAAAQAEPWNIEKLRELYDAYDLKIWMLRKQSEPLFIPNPSGERSDLIIPGGERLAAKVLSDTVDLMILQSELRKQMEFHSYLELAQRAVAYQPDNTEYLLRLGALQAQCQKNEDAINTYLRVLDIDPTNESALRQLRALGAPAAAKAPAPVLDETPAPQP
ncbi:MAG: tetratricopeptide repeat protein [Phycisphaerales bacterium]|nr:tetratricopeptide repeat protein [Phycisphaerales bacterium]